MRYLHTGVLARLIESHLMPCCYLQQTFFCDSVWCTYCHARCAYWSLIMHLICWDVWIFWCFCSLPRVLNNYVVGKVTCDIRPNCVCNSFIALKKIQVFRQHHHLQHQENYVMSIKLHLAFVFLMDLIINHNLLVTLLLIHAQLTTHDFAFLVTDVCYSLRLMLITIGSLLIACLFR